MQRGAVGCIWLYALASVLLPLGLFGLHALAPRWFFPALLPDSLLLEPLLALIGNPRTQAALGLSAQVALLVTGLAVLFGYPAARALTFAPLAGRGVILAVLFLPTVIPPIAIGIGLNSLMLQLGLAGTLIGVCIVHLIPVLPYVILTLSSMLSRYDRHYEEQAQVLGASAWQVWWLVTLPMSLPALAVAALFAFLISWSEYLFTALIGGGRVITLPVLLFALVAGGNPTTLAGVALLIVAVPMLAILLASRLLGGGPQVVGVR